jgi:hypothetical protein
LLLYSTHIPIAIIQYHFGHPNDSAETQVKHFLDTVGKVGAGDFLVLDIEAADSKSAATVGSFASEFVHLLHNKTQAMYSIRPPIFVYTGAWFWDPQTGGSR